MVARSDDEVHQGLLPNPVRHAPTAYHSTVAAGSMVGLGLVDHSAPIYRACASRRVPGVDMPLDNSPKTSVLFNLLLPPQL